MSAFVTGKFICLVLIHRSLLSAANKFAGYNQMKFIQ
ncbi:MAG: hypothetical protein ACI8P3_002103 [Saprospiraceae bacterium]